MRTSSFVFRALSILATLSALFASCSESGLPLFDQAFKEELTLVLPPVPPAWASLPGLRMLLSWRGPEGRLHRASGEPGSSLRVEVERGSFQAILAESTSDDRPLSPAGALYPEVVARSSESTDGGHRILLDWKGGYSARIARSLESAGIDPSSFDLYRLVDSACERTGDPWLVPPLEAARRLAAREFRIDLYKEPRRFRVALPPGPWACESPFADLPIVDPGRTGEDRDVPSVVELPAGIWRFLGPSILLFVSVDEEGRSCWVVGQKSS
jgi:hypothetical protein